MALISVAELADRIEEPDLVVCDVRFYLADHGQGRREYDEAHLPGARFVDLHTELAGTDGGGRHPLPTVAEFAKVLGRLGVGPGSMVVVYDSAGGATASRLWWMLRSVGHGRVAVLDGGYPAWVEAGHPVTAEVPQVSPTQYSAAPAWTGPFHPPSSQGLPRTRRRWALSKTRRTNPTLRRHTKGARALQAAPRQVARKLLILQGTAGSTALGGRRHRAGVSWRRNHGAWQSDLSIDLAERFSADLGQ